MVAALPWVKKVNVTMSAQPARPLYAEQLPVGLQSISNIVAVSSCKVKTSTALCRHDCYLCVVDFRFHMQMFAEPVWHNKLWNLLTRTLCKLSVDFHWNTSYMVFHRMQSAN